MDFVFKILFIWLRQVLVLAGTIFVASGGTLRCVSLSL